MMFNIDFVFAMCSHIERTKILEAFKTKSDVNTIFLSKVYWSYKLAFSNFNGDIFSFFFELLFCCELNKSQIVA